MSMDVDIYAAVLHRVAEVDHGWGKPYDFQGLYVLDHAVLAVENPQADFNGSAREHTFDEALKSALRAKSAELQAENAALRAQVSELQGELYVREAFGNLDALSARVGQLEARQPRAALCARSRSQKQ
jgi:hypothetical protein